MKIRKAVIPAAGYGTRFLPVTKGIPKEMLSIVDRPAIHYIVEEAVNAGIEEIIIVISNGKTAIKSYFGAHGIYDGIKNRDLLKPVDDLLSKAKFTFVLQEPMRGNGDAVLVTKEVVGNEPFVVLFGDDVIYTEGKNATEQIIDVFNSTGKCVVGVQKCTDEIACTCGCILPGNIDGKLMEVLDIIEKPSIDNLPSNYASFGRFVLTPDIFEELENAPLYKDEIYLTVALRSLIKKHGGFAYEFDGKRYDIGSKVGFFKAMVEYGLRSPYEKEFKEYLKDLVKGF